MADEMIHDNRLPVIEGVHESEIVAWLRQRGGVDVDAVAWHPGNWEPEPDTYRIERGV